MNKKQTIARKVLVTNRSHFLKISSKNIRALFRALDDFPKWKIPGGELSIAFLDDIEMADLHKIFLDDPTTTDVITFPNGTDAGGRGETGLQNDTFAGEICVCVPQAIREAPRFGKTPADELLLYLVHGWLHLAGHDDHHAKPRAAMRRAERETLAFLGKFFTLEAGFK